MLGSVDRITLERTVRELFEYEHRHLHNALVRAIMEEAYDKAVARASSIMVTPRLILLLLCAGGSARVMVCTLVREKRGTKYDLARTLSSMCYFRNNLRGDVVNLQDLSKCFDCMVM